MHHSYYEFDSEEYAEHHDPHTCWRKHFKFIGAVTLTFTWQIAWFIAALYFSLVVGPCAVMMVCVGDGPTYWPNKDPYSKIAGYLAILVYVIFSVTVLNLFVYTTYFEESHPGSLYIALVVPMLVAMVLLVTSGKRRDVYLSDRIVM